MRKFKCIKSDKSKHGGDTREYFVVGNIYNEGSKGGVLSESGYEFTDSVDIIKWLGDLCGYYLEEIFDNQTPTLDNDTMIEKLNEYCYERNCDDCVFQRKDDEFDTMSDEQLLESYNLAFVTLKTFTITTSDTTTTLTDGTHTTTINRYYTDKHDDMIALEEVVKKYKSEMEEIDRVSKLPKVGDRVKVIDDGKVYSMYINWLITNNVSLESAIKWQCGKLPNNEEKYIIKEIHPHTEFKKEVLALIEDEDNAYIINIKGLEVIK